MLLWYCSFSNLRLTFDVRTMKYHSNNDDGVRSVSHDGLKNPSNKYFFSNISLCTICAARAKCHHYCKLLSEQDLHLHQISELYICLVILAANVLEDLEMLIVIYHLALKCAFYLQHQRQAVQVESCTYCKCKIS